MKKKTVRNKGGREGEGEKRGKEGGNEGWREGGKERGKKGRENKLANYLKTMFIFWSFYSLSGIFSVFGSQ